MSTTIQIKICGLTKVAQATECVSLGADAIGLVFYPKSPRFVSDSLARSITDEISSEARPTGVFVDETYDTVMQKVEKCKLAGVQLHGRENAGLVEQLKRSGLTVIKALFQQKEPLLNSSGDYDPSAFILECGTGKLPGGNAEAWNWSTAAAFERKVPVILAGGLSVESVGQAITAGRPDAVDVSSGVEAAPGEKDLERVKAFVKAVKRASEAADYQTKRIF